MNINWDAKGYKENFSFVHEYGEDVVSLLKSPKGAAVLDLGCGNGALSVKLLEKGYKVIGMDASEAMLEIAKAQYPHMTFLQGDACSFHLKEPLMRSFPMQCSIGLMLPDAPSYVVSSRWTVKDRAVSLYVSLAEMAVQRPFTLR